MFDVSAVSGTSGAVVALLQIMLINVVLSGDNAVVMKGPAETVFDGTLET